MNQYEVLRQNHLNDYLQLTRKYNLLSAVRLAVVLGSIVGFYDYFQADRFASLWIALFLAALFLVLIKIHDKISWNRKVKKTLVGINEDELAYLSHTAIPFEDGTDKIDPAHAYAYDLDIFGKNSLFQHLNRTATWIGKTKLAELLLSLLPNTAIHANQAAVKELAEKINWRQDVLALGKLISDSREAYDKLVDWSKNQGKEMAHIWVLAMYVSPMVLIGAFIGFIATKNTAFGDTAVVLFLLNLGILIVLNKQIRLEIVNLDKVSEIIRMYGLILEKIGQENFEADRLNALKNKLQDGTGTASVQIKKLSALFANLDSIQNGLAAILFNGVFLYHAHVLRRLLQWKKAHSAQIPVWLDVIGEIETLNSLANFSCNNPAFAFPELNDRFEIEFRRLGHPLLPQEKRVCNDVDFNVHPFMILTGSNMSGKSTFLRTLGINMILAGAGAPVCATQARVHPLNVLVSMRLSDSLSDSESYFFAEVKRLKGIMNALGTRNCFVLLDEILRGTNSDDKRSGTLGVIKKMVAHHAIGAIATHDLEVCLIADDYPDTLVNRCFEVEIIDDELVFDYTLRAGICKNKSATFLMKKMEII
ncbi:MAG: DNA mismatch repair protein [Saprospiraceae bacterium]|nr:DNA mismatch repair protein [Saprospiraceae bacterium]